MVPIDVSVVAPCLNEEGNVDELVTRTLRTFDEHGINGQLVIVDDGSADATWARIQARARRDSRVVGVRHLRNQGIVASWRSGLGAAAGHRACLIDADLQNRPEDIARLAAAHTNSNDLVQGVRRPNRGVRRLLYFSRALNVLLNTVFHMSLRDNKSGFVICQRSLLVRILAHRFAYKYFQCFIAASAAALGLRIVEIETVFDVRRSGQSFLGSLPIGPSLRIVWETVKFRFETWIRTPSERTVAFPKSI
jgi:phenylacetate-CoA ligase